MDMYEGRKIVVRSSSGSSGPFTVRSTTRISFKPFLFVIVMDTLRQGIRREAPWSVLFTDDIMLCRKDKHELERGLE